MTDTFTVENIHGALVSIARDMKIATMRTAYTQLWKEQGDLSCCLMDRAGQIVTQDPMGFPVHMTTMPEQLQGLIAKFDAVNLSPGDLLVTNDPYLGGTHLPDVLIVKPMFWQGQLFGYACNRGHWADIGGAGPGSYSPTNRELYQEGLIIPPTKLFDAGVRNDGAVELILRNVRNTERALGDLRAQYASCQIAEWRAQRLVEKYGLATVEETMQVVLDRSERSARIGIGKLPDGVYESVDCVDGDGLTDRDVEIRVKVVVDGDELRVDLTNCAEQSDGGMNCTRAAALAAVQYAVKCIVDPDELPNSGSYRPVSLVTVAGTVVDAVPPGAVVGFGEIVYRVMDTTFAALAKADPARAVAPGSGSTGTVLVAGKREGGGDFTAIELSSGAWGATGMGDGPDAMRYGVGNAGHIPLEADELENPFLFERYEIVQDTGGAGRFRGGNGFCRSFRVLADQISVTLCADRHRSGPPGVHGGRPGASAVYYIQLESGEVQRLSSKTAYVPVPRGSVVHLQSAGGGGVGDPQERDRDDIIRDVRNGYVSAEAASASYGFEPTSHA